jgi:hypothetical protein
MFLLWVSTDFCAVKYIISGAHEAPLKPQLKPLHNAEAESLPEFSINPFDMKRLRASQAQSQESAANLNSMKHNRVAPTKGRHARILISHDETNPTASAL